MTIEQQLAAALEEVEFQQLSDQALIERLEQRLIQIDRENHARVMQMIIRWRSNRSDLAGEITLFADEVRGRISQQSDPLPNILQQEVAKQDDPLKLGIYDVEAAE